MPGNSRPTVPNLLNIGVLSAITGERLGDAVAFEDAQAEFLQIDPARRLLDRLGAGNDVAQRAEVVRIGHARIAVEERIGAEQRGRADAVNQFRHGAIMQRRRIKIGRDAGHERQHQPPVKPNEWKIGSTLNNLSSRPKSMRAAACAALASMLRWDNTTPFGRPSEPEVNRITAQSSGLRATSGFFQQNTAAQLVERFRPSCGCPRDRRCAALFELRDEIVEPALLDEGTRGEDGIELGGTAGGKDVGRAGSEIDHRRHAARRHHREQSDDRAVRGRQHDAEGAAFRRKRHQLAAEDRAA